MPLALKTLIGLSLSVLCMGSALAQTITTPDLNKSIIPPSPEAASLGKYGALPVTLYSGMADVSVPVTELKSAKLSLPISLTYNYNGYRPGEEASWVGLGWTLQAGGAITRVVKGKVDEDNTYPIHWSQYANILDMTNNLDFMEQVGSRLVDTEPDIYIFNFGGHSGKFILVGDRAFLLTQQDLKISQYGNGFLIVAEDGVSYYFLDTETTTTANNNTPGSSVPPYVSSWFLTRMVSADKTDEIDFQYTGWSHRQSNAMFQESYTIQRGGQGSPSTTCNWIDGHCDSWTNTNYSGATIAAKRLVSITSRSGYINFIPETTTRLDLGSTSAYALKEIDLYNKPDSVLIKKVNLSHGYFNGNNVPSQLRLDSVRVTGYSHNKDLAGSYQDSVSLPGFYTFQYNNPTDDYPKGTRAIDRWGYYNGRTSNAILFDQTISSDPLVYPAADRNVYQQYSINGTMAQITYPTGGYTRFNYEPNLYRNAGTSSGLQTLHAYVESIYDHHTIPTLNTGPFTLDHQQVINLAFGRTIIPADTTFGVLNTYPIVKIYYFPPDWCDDIGCPQSQLVYTSDLLGKTVTDNTTQVTLNAGRYALFVYCDSTSVSSYGTVTYSDTVTQSVPAQLGAGMRIASLQSFDNLNNTSPALTKTFTYPVPMQTFYGNDYGYYSVTHSNYTQDIFSSSSSSPLSTLLSNQFFYPTVIETDLSPTATGKTTHNFAGNGLDALGVYEVSQMDSAYRNGNFIPIRQKINNWSTVNLINFSAFTYNTSQVADNRLPLVSPMPFDTVERYTLYAPSGYAISCDHNVLQSTDEISFDPNGLNPLTVHTDFYYDNPNYLQYSRVVKQNSKGNAVTTRLKYPLDYNYVSCGSLYSIDTTYKSARDAASFTYGECAFNRFQAATAAWDEVTPVTSDPAVMNVLRSYPCEVNYPGNTASVVSTMNSAIHSYYGCLWGNLLPDAQLAVTLMQMYNIRNSPVEKIVSLNKSGPDNPSGTDYLVGATKTDFHVSNQWAISPLTLYETKFSPNPVLLSDFTSSPGNYYQSRVNFKYDNLDNLIEQSKTGDMKTAYVWDYNGLYPIAEVKNADTASIAYTSFEADGRGNWAIQNTNTDPVGFSGNRSYNLSYGAMTRSGLNAATAYIVSYWTNTGHTFTVTGSTGVAKGKTIQGWTFFRHTVSGVTAVTISGAGDIDEVRLYPLTGQMTTYTYEPLVGITSQTDVGNRSTYYEYDGLARLKRVRDQDNNILKTFDYQLQATAGCGSGCYIVPMQTFAGTVTLSYPVGVFNISGKLLGNATTADDYVTKWNSDTADNRIGTLAKGGDSVHFNLSLNSGQTVPAGITGCRYFQYDLPWHSLDCVIFYNGDYIDWGDGTGMRLGSRGTDTPAVTPPNTSKIFNPYAQTWTFTHSWPNDSLKTITFYHSDDFKSSDLGNYQSITSHTYLQNLRGNLPQHTTSIGGASCQQASALSVSGIANWSSVTSVTTFELIAGDLVTPCEHLNYAQDFMANNRGLNTIITTWTPIGPGYYEAGYRDTTFKLSRLKSDWNTWFTELQDIEISDDHWNREDLSQLKKLKSFFLLSSNYNHNNDPSNNFTLTIPASVTDNVLIQIDAGAGQTVTGGQIYLETGPGSYRTSASVAAYNDLVSKGWYVYAPPLAP